MIPAISQQDDGWLVDSSAAPESPSFRNNLLPSNHYSFMQSPTGNALGLALPTDPPVIPVARRPPSPVGSASITYYSGTPHASGYVHALMSEGLSVDLPSVSSSHSFENSHVPLNHPDVSSLPSPRFLLRPVPPTVAQSTQPPPTGSSENIVHPLPPATSDPPRVMARLPAPSKRGAGQKRKPRKRKRTEQVSPEDSGEEESVFHAQLSRARPNMLLASSQTALTNIQSVTQHLAIVRPVAGTGDGDQEMRDLQYRISEGDEQVVESLYEEPREGDTVDLRTLCDLVDKLLEEQAKLHRSIQQIDTRTRQITTNAPNPSTGGGTRVSPPEPTAPVNWDQNIQCDAPAGRRRRAERRVLIMGLIRETIFRLLCRLSVHDPLPPPPPPGLRAPTETNFAFRWQESYKSVFNQLAANIVVQKIVMEQPDMLSADEAEELPTMVSKHIQYLCRCYKQQSREDAEDFNTQRRNRCGAGTRKRQLFATRLQVIDMFPQHLGKHRHLIAHLGVDGTSSDEEDPKGSGVYKIKNKPQLSSKVTLLKRDLDHVYQLYFKGPGTKGSQVHRRIPSSVDSTRPFLIRELPLSCISRAWYQGLEPAEQEFYQFSAHNYDFSFPMSLLNVRESGWPVGERSRDVSP